MHSSGQLEQHIRASGQAVAEVLSEHGQHGQGLDAVGVFGTLILTASVVINVNFSEKT
jgi:hypothetical protein